MTLSGTDLSLITRIKLSLLLFYFASLHTMADDDDYIIGPSRGSTRVLVDGDDV